MDRTITLLKTINSSLNYVSLKNLATDLKVTVRTIRNDLDKLEESLKQVDVSIIRNRKEGIKLSKKMDESELASFIKLINETRDYISFEDRSDIIIERLLLNNEYVTLDELCNVTLTSKSSLQKNIAAIEECISEWHLSIEKKKHLGIRISGKEIDIRFAILNHIIKKIKQSDFDQSYIALVQGKNLFVNNNFDSFVNNYLLTNNYVFVTNFIKRYENKNGVEFTDEGFLSIFFFVCISINRASNGYELKESNYALDSFFEKKHINKLIENEVSFINTYLTKKINQYELESIFMFMLSEKRKNDSYDFLNDYLLEDQHFLEQSSLIVKNFIKLIDEYLKVNLSDDTKLFKNLLLHIRPTIFRLLFGIKLNNPLREDIKQQYPIVFSACQYASSAIISKTNSTIDENEISYLALHVEASLEKMREIKDSDYYKAIIVCPEGVGTSAILYYKLLNRIPSLVIDKICSILEFEQMDRKGIDLVITTVTIVDNKQLDVIKVNPLLYEEDIERIKKALTKLSTYRSNSLEALVEDLITVISKSAIISDYNVLKKDIISYFENNKKDQYSLREFIKEENILVKQKANTWEDAFKLAGDLLYKNGYVEKRYIKASIDIAKKYGLYMLLRDGVALMHANSVDGFLSVGFSFVTLDKPVSFVHEGNTYEIRFVIGLSANTQMKHYDAITKLVEILNDDKNYEEIINSNNTNEFITCLLEKI